MEVGTILHVKVPYLAIKSGKGFENLDEGGVKCIIPMALQEKHIRLTSARIQKFNKPERNALE